MSVDCTVAISDLFVYRVTESYYVAINKETSSLIWLKFDTKLILELITEVTRLDVLYDNLKLSKYEIEWEDFIIAVQELIDIGILVENGIYKSSIFDNTIEFELDMNNKISISALLEISNICNLKCVHCYHDEELLESNFSKSVALIDELFDEGIIFITFSGGEFTLIPFWKELIEYCRARGFIVSLISNLTNISESEIPFFNQSNFRKVKTSLYGVSQNTHDNIVGINGSYEKTMTIINKIKNNVSLSVNFLIMRSNYMEALEVRETLTNEIELIFDYKIFPTRTNDNKNENFLIGSEELLFLLTNNLLHFPQSTQCGISSPRIRINSNGDVFLCEYLNIQVGNIYNDKLKNIFFNPVTINLIEYSKQYLPNACVKCSASNFCEKCPATVWNENGLVNDVNSFVCYFPKLFYEISEIQKNFDIFTV